MRRANSYNALLRGAHTSASQAFAGTDITVHAQRRPCMREKGGAEAVPAPAIIPPHAPQLIHLPRRYCKPVLQARPQHLLLLQGKPLCLKCLKHAFEACKAAALRRRSDQREMRINSCPAPRARDLPPRRVVSHMAGRGGAALPAGRAHCADVCQPGTSAAGIGHGEQAAVDPEPGPAASGRRLCQSRNHRLPAVRRQHRREPACLWWYFGCVQAVGWSGGMACLCAGGGGPPGPRRRLT